MEKPIWIVFDLTGVLFNGGKPIKEMWELASDLKKVGYKLAICTNLSLRDSENLSEFDIFEKIIDGNIHNSLKPNPKVFEIVEEKLNVSENQIFYIDDFEINTQTAKKLFNWQVYTFGNVEDIRKKLLT